MATPPPPALSLMRIKNQWPLKLLPKELLLFLSTSTHVRPRLQVKDDTPYFLSSADHPNLILTTSLLTGPNYPKTRLPLSMDPFPLTLIYHIGSGGNQDVQTYFTRLKVLWDEFAEFHPTAICTCVCVVFLFRELNLKNYTEL